MDLSEYTSKIYSPDDLPLWEEANKAWMADAPRAAYIMIWLSCAESLKRRFREAERLDGNAGKIVGEFENLEKKHQSIDTFLLDKATTYGFITEAEKIVLFHVFQMRCLFAHPYEQHPTKEQVVHAAAAVVNLVLSRPTRLKEGFVNELLKRLLNESSYLDDLPTVVADFAAEVLPRIDESIYRWMLNKYWKDLEGISDSSLEKKLFNRGVWFSQSVLSIAGCNINSFDEWHSSILRFPKTMSYIFRRADLFQKIGERAQDSLVGRLLEESSKKLRFLKFLEQLCIDGVLSDRQKERFLFRIKRISPSDAHTTKLTITTCFNQLIDWLKSHNWDVQNPAIDFIRLNRGEIGKLDEPKQTLLGRNVLQVAEGASFRAESLLEEIVDDDSLWPFSFLKGIFLEIFTNETNEIRLKVRHLEKVLSVINKLEDDYKTTLAVDVSVSIGLGTPKGWVEEKILNDTIERLASFKWAIPITEALESKRTAFRVI